MKNTLLLSLFSSLFLLGACGDEDSSVKEQASDTPTETTDIDETLNDSDNLSQAEWMEQNGESTTNDSSIMADDSTLTSNVFELEFKNAEIIQSPSENSLGVYVTFDLTNISENNVVPFDVLTDYVYIQQTTETSIVSLENNYYELDAFGDDTDSYNDMVTKNNQLSNELLPQKTTEVSYAYYLEDETLPLEIFVYDTNTFDVADSYLYDLTQAEWMEQNGPEFNPATYEDGILTTEQGIFEFQESSYSESYEENPVVIVRFDYTNTTDENQNIEFLIWDYFDGKQIFENTTESTRPLMMDEEDNYFDEYHNTQVEVNPSSTVSGAYGFVLKDDSAPLTLDFINEIGETIGTKEISLQ